MSATTSFEDAAKAPAGNRVQTIMTARNSAMSLFIYVPPRENVTENISIESAEKLYGTAINSSVSRLERYASCPYSYYLEYGLKAKERAIYKLETPDTGTFLHEIIDRFTKYMLDNNIDWRAIEKDKCDEISPILSNYQNQFSKILVAFPFRKELEAHYGEYLFKMYDASLRAFDEKIIPELIEENKLSSKYDEILGGAQIEFRGGTYNLSQLGKFMQDKDRETRKAASIAMDKWLGEHEQAIGDIYDKLVKLRDSMAKKLGFENFVELGYLRLGRTDYNAEMVANYRKQIATEVVPVCNKLYKAQMKSLGIKKPQAFDYALSFASGNAKPAGDPDYLEHILQWSENPNFTCTDPSSGEEHNFSFSSTIDKVR